MSLARRVRPSELSTYLLAGQLSSRGCLERRRSTSPWSQPSARRRQARPSPLLAPGATRWQHTTTNASSTPSPPPPPAPAAVPLRKRLKDSARQLKASGAGGKSSHADRQTVAGWELTVGVEIHAQLNAPTKLFSPASTPASLLDAPNAHVAPLDLALPGAQPVLRSAAVVVAGVRAALALGCEVNAASTFDRKHYFHHDQPAGYQITQHARPLAVGGEVVLYPHDGIAPQDHPEVRVRIKQVQLEQDTAKTVAQPGGRQLVDFNRVGVPLVEVVGEPQMHHPATAAAFVRKVQALLAAAGACVGGMEEGGLRADVNVSVRRVGTDEPLGTRTEIKNLASLRAVEDAVVAERDRQIAVLSAPGGSGVVAQETRAWTLGGTETRRLRGKEGEVDYRYMPEPDLAPLVLGEGVVERVREGMARLPDEELAELTGDHFGLTVKDALSLMALDGGARVEYFYNVLDELQERAAAAEIVAAARDLDTTGAKQTEKDATALPTLAANWILHELGRLTADDGAQGGSTSTSSARPYTASEEDDADNLLGISPSGHSSRIPVPALADILWHLHARLVTARVAKDLLWGVWDGSVLAEHATVAEAIAARGLLFRGLDDDEYRALARDAVAREESLVKAAADKGEAELQRGKVMFLVGKVMRDGPAERMDPLVVERVVREAVRARMEELREERE